MPVKKSATKALRQSVKRRASNQKVKELLRRLKKQILTASSAKDQTKVEELFRKFQKNIDKAVKKGIVKKNKAARNKSRLSKRIKSQK